MVSNTNLIRPIGQSVKIMIPHFTSFCIFLVSLNCLSQQRINLLNTNEKEEKYAGLNIVIDNILPCAAIKGDTIFGRGTCTITDYKDLTVIITAKHVIPGTPKTGDIVRLKFFHDSIQVYQSFIAIVPRNKEADLIMLLPQIQSGSHLPKSTLSFGKNNFGFKPGDEMWAFGYPKSIPLKGYFMKNNGFPSPIRKKLHFSTLYGQEGNYGLIFGGSLAPGMSGGPILFYDSISRKWELIAVISLALIEKSIDNGGDNVNFSSFSYGLLPSSINSALDDYLNNR